MSHTMNHWGKLTIILFLGIATCLTSCQKEPKEDPEPTKKELLVNKWTVLDVLAPNNISVIGLDIAQIKCLKDNIFTIAANGTYTIDEGTVVCDPSSAGSGSWPLPAFIVLPPANCYLPGHDRGIRPFCTAAGRPAHRRAGRSPPPALAFPGAPHRARRA